MSELAVGRSRGGRGRGGTARGALGGTGGVTRGGRGGKKKTATVLAVPLRAAADAEVVEVLMEGSVPSVVAPTVASTASTTTATAVGPFTTILAANAAAAASAGAARQNSGNLSSTSATTQWKQQASEQQSLQQQFQTQYSGAAPMNLPRAPQFSVQQQQRQSQLQPLVQSTTSNVVLPKSRSLTPSAVSNPTTTTSSTIVASRPAMAASALRAATTVDSRSLPLTAVPLNSNMSKKTLELASQSFVAPTTAAQATTEAALDALLTVRSCYLVRFAALLPL